MNIIKYILWWIYPKRCSVCNKIIDRHSLICDNCSEHIECAEKFCIKCGAVREACRCRYNVYRFIGCVAPFKIGKYSMQAVYNLKFKSNMESAEFLSENMMKSIKKYFDFSEIDAVTAVPMGRLEQFKRGFNQSEVIAKHIARALGLEYIKLLYKCKENRVQHTLNRAQRFDNVKGVFSAKDTKGIKTVLLVDDIITTGATLNECTKALMLSGVNNIYCAVAVTNSGLKKMGEENED